MPLDELAVLGRIIGSRQLLRRLRAGAVSKVFVARDADPKRVSEILEEALARGIEIEWVESMRILGRACAISRETAAAGIPWPQRS